MRQISEQRSFGEEEVEQSLNSVLVKQQVTLQESGQALAPPQVLVVTPSGVRVLQFRILLSGERDDT